MKYKSSVSGDLDSDDVRLQTDFFFHPHPPGRITCSYLPFVSIHVARIDGYFLGVTALDYNVWSYYLVINSC